MSKKQAEQAEQAEQAQGHKVIARVVERTFGKDKKRTTRKETPIPQVRVPVDQAEELCSRYNRDHAKVTGSERGTRIYFTVEDDIEPLTVGEYDEKIESAREANRRSAVNKAVSRLTRGELEALADQGVINTDRLEELKAQLAAEEAKTEAEPETANA